MNVESIYGSLSLNIGLPLGEFSGPMWAKNRNRLNVNVRKSKLLTRRTHTSWLFIDRSLNLVINRLQLEGQLKKYFLTKAKTN